MRKAKVLLVLTLPVLPFGISKLAPKSDPSALGSRPEASDEAAARPLFELDRLVGGNSAEVAFCFAPGTGPEVMAHYQQVMETDPTGARYQLGGRWSGAQGSPRALTWSFVPDGLAVDGGTSELFSRLDQRFAGQGGRATWIARFQESFDRWAMLTGTSYTRITAGGNDWDDGAAWGSGGSASRGDVRISMIVIDGGGGVLAYNYYPSNGDMVIDRADNWANTGNNNRFLRNVIMHEHGHGLGMAHVCSSDSSQLMEPFLNTAFDGPQDDDIRGGQRHYGDDFEPNDSPAAATDVGVLEVGPTSLYGPVLSFASLLSLDGDGKNDYFRFSLTGERRTFFGISPVGRTYDNSSQNGDGSCNAGNPTNSLAAANLNLQLIAADGVTVLHTGAAQPAGVGETVPNLVLAAGNYYLRVYEEGAPTQAQFYILSMSASFLDCNANGVGDPCEFSCGEPGGPCDVAGCGEAADCNNNGTLDGCETGFADCNANAVPDECELASQDCNANTVLDVCDINGGGSLDVNGNDVPDECEGPPAATITGAISRKGCDLTLSAPVGSEPRQGGITEVRIAFDVPPAGPGASPIQLEEATCASPAFTAYSGASALSSVIAGNELVLTFSPGLENARTYRIHVGGTVTSVAGQSIEIRGLVGDVDGDGAVNGADRSMIVGVWTGGGFSCVTDVTGDGATNAADRSVAVGAWTGSENCAP